MNRFVTILVLVLFVGLIAIGAIWFLRPNQNSQTPKGQGTIPQNNYPTNSYSPPTQQTNNQYASTPLSAYQAALAADGYPDNIKPGRTVEAGGYALQLWAGDHTGGQALLKFDSLQNKWVIVDPGGGEWSVATLVSIGGVPTSTAESLLSQISH